MDQEADDIALAVVGEVGACAGEERGEAGIEDEFPQLAEMQELVEVGEDDVCGTEG